ncbi:Hypothetical protein HVPorG_03080 (plasmid) [Roseomonas mucosa]|nr:Hypothetical protein HVPorG_03080 [Roseomonas mucosa]
MTRLMTTDLFALAVTLQTIRRRGDVCVGVLGQDGQPLDLDDAAQDWRAFVRLVTDEILSNGGESTTETADIALVRGTNSYRQFVAGHPALVQQVNAVVTVRDSVVEEVFDE